jgi:hypothetical protein
MSVDALVRISEGTRALTEAKTAFEAIRISDSAEAYRYALKISGAGIEAINKAAELKLRAERRAGELLRDMPKASGARGVGPIAVAPSDRNPTYAEQGIDKRIAARCQKIASIPEEKFEEFLSVAEEITNVGIVRIGASQTGAIPVLDFTTSGETRPFLSPGVI